MMRWYCARSTNYIVFLARNDGWLIASLVAEDIDWQYKVLSFIRMKTDTASILRFEVELEIVLR